MYIALRLISQSSLLLFVLLAYIICLFPHCPLGDRLALPCFPEFRASPPFVHIPCSRMVITGSKFWIHLSVASASTCCDYWSAHCHAYSQSSSKTYHSTHTKQAKINITDVCPCSVCPVPLKMVLNTSVHDCLVAIAGKGGNFHSEFGSRPSH